MGVVAQAVLPPLLTVTHWLHAWVGAAATTQTPAARRLWPTAAQPRRLQLMERAQ